MREQERWEMMLDSVERRGRKIIRRRRLIKSITAAASFMLVVATLFLYDIDPQEKVDRNLIAEGIRMEIEMMGSDILFDEDLGIIVSKNGE